MTRGQKPSFPGLLDGLESLVRFFYLADRPLLAQFWVETRCNLQCGGCQIREPTNQSPVLTLDEMKAVIFSLRQMRVRLLHLTGGETFLNPHLSELISTARSTHYPYPAIPIVTIISNGTRLLEMKDSERESVFENLSSSGLTHLSLSVDSLHWPNPKHRDSQLHALINLSQNIAKYQIIPTINWVLCSTDSCEEVIEASKQVILSGSHFNLLLYSSVGGEFSTRNDNLVPSKAQVVTLAEQLLRFKKTIYTPPFGTVANMVRELQWMINHYAPQLMWSCDGSNHSVITIKPSKNALPGALKLGFCQEFSHPGVVYQITLDRYRAIRKSSFARNLRGNCRGCSCSAYIRLDQRIEGSFGFADFTYHVVVGAYLRGNRMGELIRKVLLRQTLKQNHP
jgi:MoaA/NifB/PqqE/SkfB family radical SAM enzyme